MPSLVGSEMCIRDRYQRRVHGDCLRNTRKIPQRILLYKISKFETKMAETTTPTVVQTRSLVAYLRNSWSSEADMRLNTFVNNIGRAALSGWIGGFAVGFVFFRRARSIANLTAGLNTGLWLGTSGEWDKLRQWRLREREIRRQERRETIQALLLLLTLS
eukprot:TRINITY_DN5704_c0_g3_i14.p1 TRINITY_DN5704_c0_g3~~TRINITY_DN5704_c0_g3_i14.p1  ORF type:complete len:160 (+),score=32.64 TRINITY_DN5704_c0_g3_i14:90-569(+)